MRILIDADACPVVDIALTIAREKGLKVLLFCDTSHVLEREGAQTITVSKGPDSVDFELVNAVRAGDIVITQDYGLAAMALSRRAYGIHQNGHIYDETNIDGLLSARHVARKARSAGGRIKGPPKRTQQMDRAFEQALRDLIDRAM